MLAKLPIIVNVDRVIIKSRWLDEALLGLLRERPSEFFRLPFLRLSGSRAVAEAIAERARLDVEAWPENSELVAHLEEQSQSGRRIVLVTAAPKDVTAAITRRYPFIREVMHVADGLSGKETAEVIARAFPEGFVYAGASSDDTAIWTTAAAGLAVNMGRQEAARLTDKSAVQVFDVAKPAISTLRRALRVHQWAKNVLVFIPLVLGGRAGDAEAWLNAAIGVLAISLVASAMYLVNDLLDLPSDRRHWSKKSRPIASGTMSIRLASLLSLLLTAAGLGLAWTQGILPLTVVLTYMVVTLCYSARLKSVPVLDVFVLASLFTLRLWFGIVLSEVRVSPWLLVFSMFLFLALSLAKRHTEVLRLHAHGLTEAPGRSYRGDDAPFTLTLGLSATMAAVLILIVYLIEDAFPRQQYAMPQLLWVVPPILFLFLGRVWLLCQRGQLNDDPVAFAMKDRVSLALGFTMSVFALLAIVGVG